MKFIKPSGVNGICQAPSSKSEMQRVIAAASLAKGISEILYHSLCEDSKAALRVVQGLGSHVLVKKNKIIVTGRVRHSARFLDCGESGLCLRMFAPIAALFEREIILKARGSLLKRPVSMVESGLKGCGVYCQSQHGFPPLAVKGPFSGGNIYLDGSLSSQHVSGFLLALPLVKKDSLLIVDSLQSEPYVRLTLAVMNAFGVSVDADFERGRFRIPGSQSYSAQKYEVEGDWSSASFLLVAGAIAGRVRIKNLNHRSLQADQAIVEVLKKCGAKLSFLSGSVETSKSRLLAFEYDATNAPDLFPPLTVLACFCQGTSRIRGVHRLHHKESDRAAALVDVFSQIGARIRIHGDILEVEGSKVKGGRVDSHQDHRLAMAAAVAALGSEKGVEIINHECVAKSYPKFFDDLSKLEDKP